MVYDGLVVGKYVSLSSVTEDDAGFTLMARQNKRLTRYLPKVTNSLQQQQEWIRHQRTKEGDYFFVAKDPTGNPVGTVGIYDIAGKTGEGGRLTSIGNALQSLEIQYLVLEFDFGILGLDKVITYVYAENTSAIKLSKIMGIHFEEPCTNEDGVLVCNGSITREQFTEAIPVIKKMLHYENESDIKK